MSKRKGKSNKTKTNPRSRQQQRKSKQRRLNLKPVLIGVFAILAGAAGFYALPYLSPAPSVVHPNNPSELDPAVEALLTPMLASAEANPRDAKLHAELGLAYEANGLWQEAGQSYNNALHLDDSDVNWHLHQAIVSREAGDFDTAIAILHEQATQNPSHPSLQNRYADALLEAGELEEAEASFRKLISLSGHTAQGYVGLGDILIQRGAGEEAVQVLEQALARNPDYKQAHYLLGRAYAMVGRDAEAEASLARGVGSSIEFLRDPLSGKLEQYNVNATGRISQASLLLNAGNPEAAARLLEESYQYHNTNAMLLNTLASAYLKTGRHDDALRHLNRAKELDDEQFFTYLNLYTWALRSGKDEEALQFADQAIERAPERDDVHLSRAQALTELGRLEEALTSALKAVEIDSNKAGNHGLVGDIYVRLERYAEAEPHLEQALKLNPNLLPAIVSLAQTKWQLNKQTEARQLLNQAQQMAPNHPRITSLARQLSR